MIRKRILIGAVLISALFCTAALGGTALSPMLTEITLPPGSSYEDDISLTNTGDEPIVIEVRVSGFTAPEGIPIFTDGACLRKRAAILAGSSLCQSSLLSFL